MCQQAGIRHNLRDRGAQCIDDEGVHMRDVLPPGRVASRDLEVRLVSGAAWISLDDDGVDMRDVLPPGRVASRNLQVRLVSGAAWIGSVSTRWTSPTRLHSLLALLVQKY